MWLRRSLLDVLQSSLAEGVIVDERHMVVAVEQRGSAVQRQVVSVVSVTVDMSFAEQRSLERVRSTAVGRELLEV